MRCICSSFPGREKKVAHGYYYRHMSRAEQGVYEKMLACFTALEAGTRVLRLEGSGLWDVFFRLKLDRPDIFYVTSFSWRFAQGSEYCEIVPEYLFDKNRIREHRKAIAARVTKLVRPVLDKSQREKELFIHDFICDNVRYDKLKKPYSHEVTGPLINGVGVCEGIAKTVQLLCGELGVECITAVSAADPENDVKYAHAWNVVKIDGRYYHMDATYDNTLGRYGGRRYDYFNLDDRRFFRDHRAVIYPVPECTDPDGFYYKVEKRSYTKLEDVRSRADQAMRKKLDYFIFHWRGGYLTRDVLVDIINELEAAAEKRGRHVELSVNYPQAVLRAAFPEGAAGTGTVQEEQADEAEET